jgi:DNA-binding transcriptional ArsR family regulator
MARRPTYRLEDPDQLRAMASPARQRIVAGFEALGTASVRELADHLGRSPESLYFHLRKLVDTGLVEDVGERPAGRRPERLYRLVADRLKIAGDLEQPEYRDALAETCRSITRATERDYCRALELGTARLDGAGRNLSLHHFHVHLKPADRRRMVQLLEELTAFVIEHNDPERGDLHSYTAALSPVAPRGDPPSETDHA